jgi:hypothetical protein
MNRCTMSAVSATKLKMMEGECQSMLDDMGLKLDAKFSALQQPNRPTCMNGSTMKRERLAKSWETIQVRLILFADS